MAKAISRNRFWVTVFNGEYWISYAEVNTYQEALDVLLAVPDDPNIWESKISMIL